jgi:hypothetical protein
VSYGFLINDGLTKLLGGFFVDLGLALRGELLAFVARFEGVLLLGVFLLSAM